MSVKFIYPDANPRLLWVETPFLFSDLAALTAKSDNKTGFSTSEKARITQLPDWHEVDMYNYTSYHNLSLSGE